MTNCKHVTFSTLSVTSPLCASYENTDSILADVPLLEESEKPLS